MNAKKMMITFSLAIAMTFGSIQRADAIVGICAWNPILIGAGFAASTVGGYGSALGFLGAEAGLTSDKFIYKALGVVSGAAGIVAGIVGFVGVVILPDGTVTMEYQKITPELQKKLKITNEEAKSFNSELDQVNLLTSQVAMDLSKIENPTVKDSENAWTQYITILDDKTLSAMTKVTMAMLKKI